ncbi:UNVERIFIED_CONTAM: hypothetical protein Sindi_1822100 [Sesamum indicum]
MGASSSVEDFDELVPSSLRGIGRVESASSSKSYRSLKSAANDLDSSELYDTCMQIESKITMTGSLDRGGTQPGFAAKVSSPSSSSSDIQIMSFSSSSIARTSHPT